MFAVVFVATAAVMSADSSVSPVVLRSTAPRAAVWRPAPRNNFSLDLTGSPGQPQVQINYHVPLSGRGFLGFGDSLWQGILHPFESLKTLGSEAHDTTLSLYGLKIHPTNVFVEQGPSVSSGTASGAPTARRRRLALMPILYDIEDELKQDALYRGLEMAAPSTRSLNRSQQTSLLNDMLILHHQHETPLFTIPADGVDFLMKPSSTTR